MEQVKTQRRITKHLTAAGLVLAGAGLCLIVAPCAPTEATTSSTPHTESFTSRSLDTVQLGKNGGFAEFSKDIANGKVIGADTLTGSYHATTGMVTGEVTFLRKGGLMTGTFALDTNTLDVEGSISGGLGRYRGVSGTITGQAAGRRKTEVTLFYTR